MSDSSVRARWLWIAVTVAAGLVAWIAVGVGSRDGQLTFDASWPRLLSDASSLQQQVLVQLRLPRVLAGLLVGAALSIAGLVLQGVTRNPLADPFLLGISGGAGLVVVCLRASSYFSQIEWWMTPIAAFIGAMIASMIVAIFAREGGGRLTVVGLVLAGVVINALCAAVITFITARLDPFRLRITTLWLVGGIGLVRWPQLCVVGSLVAVGGLVLRAEAHRLNAFALGSDGASYVGVDSAKLLRLSSVIASLLAALAVSLAGLLGYVGLIVPHAVRLLVGHDFRHTLPLASSAGALLVVAADLVARTAFSPEELPVGVLTALLGCPTLLVLLRRQLKMGR